MMTDNKYKLNPEHLEKVEEVLEEMWNDPQTLAFELFYLRRKVQKMDQIIQENTRLRAIFPKILEALGHGGGCTPQVSLEFLEAIPEEIQQIFRNLPRY